MNGRFLHARNTSTYAPQEKNPKGERHEDWGMYSCDKSRKKLVLRQFHIEGFVNQYVVDRVSDDGREIVFVTRPSKHPRRVPGPGDYKSPSDSFQETFEIFRAGKEFEGTPRARDPSRVAPCLPLLPRALESTVAQPRGREGGRVA